MVPIPFRSRPTAPSPASFIFSASGAAATQPAAPGAAVPLELLQRTDLPDAAAVAVVVDGVLRPELSRGLGALPGGAYVGPLEGAPPAVAEKLVRGADGESGLACWQTEGPAG